MYRFSYAEILEDSSDERRVNEMTAFERAIDLLKAAQEKGPKSSESPIALDFVKRLWIFLIEDLMSSENSLPEELRAQLISVGIWVMKEAEKIQQGQSENFRGLIDINATIRDGLR